MFLDNGYLKPGIHFMTWEEFYSNFSFSPRRRVLLDGLYKALEIFKKCECSTLYINGSFVSEKLEPNDYDACWEGEFDKVSKNILKIEPVFFDFVNKRKNQKLKYKGEIFPAEFSADSKGTTYLDFFQEIRFSKEKKGIVAIKL